MIQSLPESANSSNTIFAYEPIWAIGTGNVPTKQQIVEMHLHIKCILNENKSSISFENTRVLYGGSVNINNAAEILNCEGVDGALIGGASLDADSFVRIGRSCP